MITTRERHAFTEAVNTRAAEDAQDIVANQESHSFTHDERVALLIRALRTEVNESLNGSVPVAYLVALVIDWETVATDNLRTWGADARNGAARDRYEAYAGAVGYLTGMLDHSPVRVTL